MRTKDPLAGLDDIDWAGLSHAYGPAGDVPDQIRALRTAETCEKALGEMFGNIFHQGTRYEASRYAVPFLVNLAATPDTPMREGILMLLSGLAIGYDEGWLPQGVDIVQWRAHVERVKATDPEVKRRELDAWVEEATDEGERRSREFQRSLYSHERELADATDALASYDAVRAAVPTLCTLLEDPAPGVRAGAGYLLGWFPEEAETSLPGLLRAAMEEPNAIVSVGLLGDASHIPVLRPLLSGEDPARRAAAALALARLGDTGPEVIEELARVSVDPPEHDVVFHDGDLRGYASATLAGLDGRAHPEAVDAVLTGLARTSEIAAFPMAAAALQLVFGAEPPRPLPPFRELQEPQQRAVRVLAGLGEETWRWVNFRQILQYWGLPDTREALGTYAEASEAH